MRREFEKGLLERPGLKGSRLAVLRVLLSEFFWGKATCWPSNARIARAAGLSPRTVQRALHDLQHMGIVRILDGDRRLIVLLDHPGADQALGDPASDRHAPGRQADADPRDRLSPEALDRSSSESETVGEISLEMSNDRTTTVPGEVPDAEPSPPPAPPAPSPRRRFADWSSAPADDPVIAAELARRTEARQAAAAPTTDEIIDAVLGIPGTVQEARGDVGDAREVSDVEGGQGGTEEAPEAVPGVAPELQKHVQEHPGTHKPLQLGKNTEETAAPWRDTRAEAARIVEQEVIRALAAIGPGATAGEVMTATMKLAGLFGDPKSMRYYKGVVNDVMRGKLPARVPIAAVEWAQRPGVVKPAAAFTGHVERCRAVRDGRSK